MVIPFTDLYRAYRAYVGVDVPKPVKIETYTTIPPPDSSESMEYLGVLLRQMAVECGMVEDQ